MAKKTVGYVQLEWKCPNCGARNPGPQKICAGCGAAQPENVVFEQAAQEALITKEEEIQRAKTGPDVHCAFCGARNPAGTKICTQCGADLVEAKARASGQVLGAHRDKPAPETPCPACGTPNLATAYKCAKCGASLGRPEPEPAKQPVPARKGGCSPVVYVVGAAVVLVVIVLAVLLTRTSDVVGSVEDVGWTRSVAVEALGPVNREDWRDEIPSDAVLGTCTQKRHHTEDQQVPNSKEVCGTPYTVDKGSGYAEVVQDCVYEVYADWCKYQAQEWRQVDEATLSGEDLSPRWPAPQLSAEQRMGTQAEMYEIVFDADGASYTYKTRDPAEFGQFQLGSRWTLKVNQLNEVVGVEPAR